MVLSFSLEEVMKVGDLVRCRYTGVMLIVTSPENSTGYVDVYGGIGKEWHMPKEHLEVIQCNQVI